MCARVSSCPMILVLFLDLERFSPRTIGKRNINNVDFCFCRRLCWYDSATTLAAAGVVSWRRIRHRLREWRPHRMDANSGVSHVPQTVSASRPPTGFSGRQRGFRERTSRWQLHLINRLRCVMTFIKQISRLLTIWCSSAIRMLQSSGTVQRTTSSFSFQYELELTDGEKGDRNSSSRDNRRGMPFDESWKQMLGWAMYFQIYFFYSTSLNIDT